MAVQTYVDEAGNTVALEEFEPNREPWTFAQVLPSIPEHYQCLACAEQEPVVLPPAKRAAMAEMLLNSPGRFE